MSNRLYVANLAAEVTPEEVQALFAAHGEVQPVTIQVEERTGQRYALVEMASEKAATRALNNLNGHEVAGKRLAVSYPDPVATRELTAKQRKAIEDILAALGETEEVPLRQVHAMAVLCGVGFVEALAKEALELAPTATLLTTDGTRPRTPGGVFFYLARYRMSPAVRRVVYNRKGKLLEPGEASSGAAG